jgi:Protein of unknown function (DUF2799)
MRNITTLLIVGPLCLIVGSCATISKDSCRNDSWYDIAFKGAMDNHDRADHISDITKTCGKIGIGVDLNLYERGFADGTRQFCEPDNGYQWGLKGRLYNGICANPEFSSAYDDGYEIYKIRQRRNEIDNRLAVIEGRLAGITQELEAENLTKEKKRSLEREYNKLLSERSDLKAEKYSLPRV